MLIKAYLFSKIARQIGHTYYSVPDFSTGPSKFYYNLYDYDIENFLLNHLFMKLKYIPKLYLSVQINIYKLENIK